MRLHAAIGLGRPEAAAKPGEDVPDHVAALVADASPELRARCREYILGHCLAPHAKWAPEPLQAAPEASEPVTVADLERQLRELAESGDRAAILAMLAALDPARYGPPGKVLPPPDSSVDTVDFSPAITSKA